MLMPHHAMRHAERCTCRVQETLKLLKCAYGIGQQMAVAYYERGVRSLEQVIPTLTLTLTPPLLLTLALTLTLTLTLPPSLLLTLALTL